MAADFVLNALNPITGKRDGPQYTFGDNYVAQRLSFYAANQGKLGRVVARLQAYEAGLKEISNIPNAHVRRSIMLMWRDTCMARSKTVLIEGQSFLDNWMSTKFREYRKKS